MRAWVRLATVRTWATIKQALGSPAIWFLIVCYLAATAYNVVTGDVAGVLTTLLLQAVYFILLIATIFITAPMPPEDVHSVSDTSGLTWYQLALVLFIILLTGYTSLAFHDLIPHGATNIPVWTALMTAVGNFGAVQLPTRFFQSPASSVINPVSYFVIPFIALLLLQAYPSSLGFGRGHRSLPVILLWCGIEIWTWAFRLFIGALNPLPLAQALIGNFFQNGFFEEFLFRGALQTRLRILVDPAWALVLGALIFGLWHLGANVSLMNGDWLGGAALSIRSQAVLGLVYGFIFMRTRNLLASSVVHVVLSTFFSV